MIDLLFTFGAVAESKTLRPTPVDDSQDCLTFLKRQVVGFGQVRASQRCLDVSELPAPWRSL